MDWYPPEFMALLGVVSACTIASSIAIVAMSFEVRRTARAVERLVHRLVPTTEGRS